MYVHGPHKIESFIHNLVAQREMANPDLSGGTIVKFVSLPVILHHLSNFSCQAAAIYHCSHYRTYLPTMIYSGLLHTSWKIKFAKGWGGVGERRREGFMFLVSIPPIMFMKGTFSFLNQAFSLHLEAGTVPPWHIFAATLCTLAAPSPPLHCANISRSSAPAAHGADSSKVWVRSWNTISQIFWRHGQIKVQRNLSQRGAESGDVIGHRNTQYCASTGSFQRRTHFLGEWCFDTSGCFYQYWIVHLVTI